LSSSSFFVLLRKQQVFIFLLRLLGSKDRKPGRIKYSIEIMKNKITWIISLLLFVLHIYLQVSLYSKSNIWEFKFMALGMALLPLLLGSILTLAISFIPNKKKSYDDKFRINLPISVSAVMLPFIVMAGVTLSNFYKRFSGPVYESIVTNPGLNCESVKNGKFDLGEGVVIERNGDRQIETYTKIKLKKECKVTWINDCEYTLTAPENPDKEIKVKIISVTKDGYVCYSGIGNENTAKYTAKRVE
jgi:hypothetical protein